MGKLPHIASLIYNQPLIITEEKLYEILEAIGPRIGLENNNISILENSNNIQNPYSESGLAIIPINGTLTHAPMTGVNSQSGLMSYQSIQANFDQALNNPSIHTILLNINSNGGQVNGCFDLVDHIYASRGTKPIIAISNESAYSAAYAIASAADKIYVTRTAGVGSIGVIALHADISKKLENDGIKYTAIKAGKYKDDGSPYKPLSDQAKSSIQSRVNDTYNLFVQTVARNRGLAPESIYNTEAQVYEGQKAVELGLADKVTTFDNVINTYGGNNMDLQAELDKTKTDLIKLQTEFDIYKKDTKEMEDAIPAMIAEATKNGQIVEVDRILSILDKCIISQKIDLAFDLIKNGNTPDQAAALIMQAKTLESKIESISSNPNNDSTSINDNILIKDAEKRAQEHIGR
ncbi:MAG: S49 family peptidase [Candidatus Thorarchaeota archaeon]